MSHTYDIVELTSRTQISPIPKISHKANNTTIVKSLKKYDPRILWNSALNRCFFHVISIFRMSSRWDNRHQQDSR